MDWIVVGAGFTGAIVAERIASVLHKKVLLVDRRGHLAGNAYDYVDEAGNIVHKHGPHIFHTNSEHVRDYLSQFTSWRPYVHKTLAAVEDKLLPLPFNLDSIKVAFSSSFAERVSAKLIHTFGYGARITILKLIDHEDSDIREFASFVYRNVYENYVKKHWGLQPLDLDASVLARLPVSVSYDDRYFPDRFQAMPANGYVPMFERMLAHERIEIALNTEFVDARRAHPAAKIVFTGPIDAYFDYRFGALPYRSVQFQLRTVDHRPVQPVGTISYPNAPGYTRITDLSHLTGQATQSAVLVKEFPEAYEIGRNEPYYPVPTPETAVRLRKYKDEARQLAGKVWFAGRLGDYSYYNMDQASGRALSLFEKQLARAA
ncbi:UDP-galactopyranose mutase [Jiella marina]|uniref:UDP-galactopyranose mutase n=1 Tax=Jiella sp. LLJ827 TaxID=2917712 RepID=UPI0021007402|nr:UDP-galactopyranose mutase [Jiella sp. LLJ827]MCQ0989476.1 UDP-galactopyranose mutase [Jiella sp. LLJ827]